MRPDATPPPRRAGARRAAAAALLGALLAAATAAAAPPPPFAARAGLDLAEAAARTWAADAQLVYLENDEDLDAAGAAPRWGYLFHSASLDRSRAYSVRDGRIVVAEHLDMRFDAPPLAPGWIDSDAALAAAERSGGRRFREEQGGRLDAMLLVRGAFSDADPDRASWTVVYAAPGAPSLFVLVDAAEGKVRRTWRG